MIVLSHTGGTGYSMTMLERAREAGAEALHVSGIGNGGELETVAAEASYAYTASHTGALLRLAQLADRARRGPRPAGRHPGARGGRARPPGPADRGPGAAGRADRRGPERLDGAGGRAEDPRGVLRRGRGLSSEQFFHGPSVALDEQDTLVVLDGGGPMADRTEAIAAAVEVTGAKVLHFGQRELGEALSVFPLTVVVQRIALELSEARGVSPDRFRYEEDPRREAAFEALGF